MHIQLAGFSHIPQLLSLLLQVLQVHHTIRPDLFRSQATKYDSAGLQRILSDPATPVFVALDGEKVLGYCFCQLKDVESNVLVPRRELYIDDLCVDEASRGRGIATALSQFVLDYAKQQGCSYVTLNVWCGNDTAMRFYENAGLTPRSITMEKTLC